jgi:hypothetical protein
MNEHLPTNRLPKVWEVCIKESKTFTNLLSFFVLTIIFSNIIQINDILFRFDTRFRLFVVELQNICLILSSKLQQKKDFFNEK